MIPAPDPEPEGRFGDRMKGAGDLNGDGIGDVWIGNYDFDVDGMRNVGRVYAISGRDGNELYKDGLPDLYVGSSPHHVPGSSQLGGTYVFGGRTGSLLRIFDLPPGDVQVGTVDNNGPQLGRGVAAPGDLNGDGEPDYVASAPTYDVDGARNVGRLYAFLSQVPPVQPPPVQPPPVQPPGARPCGTPR